jgi:hypothetical protein
MNGDVKVEAAPGTVASAPILLGLLLTRTSSPLDPCNGALFHCRGVPCNRGGVNTGAEPGALRPLKRVAVPGAPDTLSALPCSDTLCSEGHGQCADAPRSGLSKAFAEPCKDVDSRDRTLVGVAGPCSELSDAILNGLPTAATDAEEPRLRGL